MTVYVDDMKAAYRGMCMCHMIADTLEELHEMADRIKVNRRWLQKPGTARVHFDICQSKKALALAAGAIPITWRQTCAMCLRRRVTGQLGEPEDAVAWLHRYNAERRAGA